MLFAGRISIPALGCSAMNRSMNIEGWIDTVRVCALGVIDGFLAGTVFGWLNELYLQHMAPPSHSSVTVGNLIFEMAAPIPPTFVSFVLVSMFAFALVSYGVHRLWLRRLSPLLLWQVIGIGAVLLLSVAAFVLGRESYYASLPRWTVLVCLAVAVIINFIFGIVVESAARVYGRSGAASGAAQPNKSLEMTPR
jgi:hypothetical protein